MKVRQQPYKSPRDRGVDTFTSDSYTKQNMDSSEPDKPSVPASNVNTLDHLTAQKILQFIGYPPVCFVLWDGSKVSSGADIPVATMYFRDRASLYLTLLRPERHWGDLYSEGRVEVDGDLAGFLDFVYRGRERGSGWPWLNWLNELLGHRKIRNTFRKAADNIHHHYDIGNDFYRLWLDEDAMQYTCLLC